MTDSLGRGRKAVIQKTEKNILVINLPEGEGKTRAWRQGINQKDTCSKAKEKLAMNIEGH